MNDLPDIIGITGYEGLQKQVGKDTLANYLVDNYGYGKLRFAAPMKHALGMFLNEDPDMYESEQKKAEIIPELEVSRRYILQTMGTDWARNMVHKDFWVLCAKRQLEHIIRLEGKVIFSDVRFDNEAEMIRNQGGIIVSIMPVFPEPRDVEDTHASEKGLKSFNIDIVVANLFGEETPEEFASRAVSLLTVENGAALSTIHPR